MTRPAGNSPVSILYAPGPSCMLVVRIPSSLCAFVLFFSSFDAVSSPDDLNRWC